MSKEYVPIFYDWLEVTQDLSQEEKGNLIDAIVSYASGQDDYNKYLGGNSKIAFRFFKGQVDRNAIISQERSKAGSSKREQKATNENKSDQSGTKSPKKKENNNENNNENENESNNENKNHDNKTKTVNEDDSKTQTQFIPPTVEDVRNYCLERENNIDPVGFVKYYTARGWKRSNGRLMDDWRAGVRYWEKRQKGSGNDERYNYDSGGTDKESYSKYECLK